MELLEKDRIYKRMNGKRAKMDVYEINGRKITVDKTETLLEERYRPRLIDDLIVDDDIEEKLKGYIKDSNLPHLLLYSQAGGTGKTSISQVMLNELNWEGLTISSNIDRGIAVVKDKIVEFARRPSEFGNPKLINIEEIGDSTAQQTDAFKSVIDQYGKDNRIIITTNSMTKISGPLKTRFTVIDFNKVPTEQQNNVYKKIFNRIKAILTIENVEHSDNDIVTLMKKYGFSYRELIHALGECITNNKLVVTNLLNLQKSSLNDILKLINDKNTLELAKNSEVNHIQILEEISDQYLELLEDIISIQPFIIHTNEFQKQLANGVAFPSISFMDWCIHLIKDNVRFKIQ